MHIVQDVSKINWQLGIYNIGSYTVYTVQSVQIPYIKVKRPHSFRFRLQNSERFQNI